MINTKMDSRNKKKLHNPSPNMMCFVFYCCCVLKIMQGQIFGYVAVKALKMVRVFGECGRECLSGPGNTGLHVVPG
jgi:hypothetical protein